MTDLRKAAEMALEALESLDCGDTYKTHNAASALRKALTQSEYMTEVVAMHENGIYTTKQTLIQKREWVGLTEKQIYEHEWWDEETAFAVNKELKEKNGG